MEPRLQQTIHSDGSRAAREFYDGAASSYDAQLDTPANRKLRRRMRELLARYSSATGAVLDFGCGTGGDVAGFLAQGRRVLAYDPSAGMLAALTGRYGEAIRERRVVAICGELADLYAALSAFDPVSALVANFGVINHLPDLTPLSELATRRLPSLQTVILGVQNPLYLPDMGARWWWQGLWAGRGEGAIVCGRSAVRTRRFFLRPLIAALAPQFRLRASYNTWAAMRLLAFERVT